MENQSVEYLALRIKDLERQALLFQQRIKYLENQNQQLMGVVVQASHHNANRNLDFIHQVQDLVYKAFEKPLQHQPSTQTLRLKTEASAKKSYQRSGQTQRGKQNIEENRSKAYSKMNKKELQQQIQSTRRIQRRVF